MECTLHCNPVILQCTKYMKFITLDFIRIYIQSILHTLLHSSSSSQRTHTPFSLAAHYFFKAKMLLMPREKYANVDIFGASSAMIAPPNISTRCIWTWVLLPAKLDLHALWLRNFETAISFCQMSGLQSKIDSRRRPTPPKTDGQSKTAPIPKLKIGFLYCFSLRRWSFDFLQSQGGGWGWM